MCVICGRRGKTNVEVRDPKCSQYRDKFNGVIIFDSTADVKQAFRAAIIPLRIRTQEYK